MSSPARAVLADALRGALARPLQTLVSAVVVAAVCIVVLLTAGRTAATEASVLSSIDSVGTRLITITDTTADAGIDRSAVDLLVDLDSVTWAFGVGPATAVVNKARGVDPLDPVTARPVIGELPAEFRISAGRSLSSPHDAVVSPGAQASLGLADVVGSLDIGETERVGTVGRYEVSGDLADFATGVLYRPVTGDVPVRQIYVLAAPGTDVLHLVEMIEQALPASDPTAVEVRAPTQAIALRDVVTGTLGASSRQLVLITLGSGAVLVAITAAGAVASRRRDFGRQRALGATRTQVVLAVLTQSGLSGVLGSIVGTALGLLGTWGLTGQLPTAQFTGGLAIAAVYVALLGSLPPAIAASYRDPVRILRVP